MRSIYSLISKCQVLRKPLKMNKAATFSTGNYNSGQMMFDDPVEEPLTKYEKCVNEVRLVGRIGKDPWHSTTQGKTIIQFALATTKAAPEEGLEAPGTDWHYVYTQNPVLMKSVQLYVKKGMRVYVSGKLSYLYDKKTPSVMLYRFICFT